VGARQLTTIVIFPWRCRGTTAYTRQVLARHFPEIDVAATLAGFEADGGYCDCEILCNCCLAGIHGPISHKEWL